MQLIGSWEIKILKFSLEKESMNISMKFGAEKMQGNLNLKKQLLTNLHLN